MPETPEPSDESRPGVQALDRALQILEHLKVGPLGLTELSAACRLNKSTTLRLLRALQRRGYVRQLSDRKAYALGAKFLEMSTYVDIPGHLRAAAFPHLEALMLQTKETVHLSQLDGDSIIYLDKLESPETIRMHSRIGAHMPAHSTAAGRVLLASFSDAALGFYLRTARLEAHTPHTTTDPEQIRRILHVVRKQGYAVDDQENELDVRCVAVPIEVSGRALAAISISCPAFRTPLQRLEALVEPAKATALAIAAEISGSNA